MKLVFELEVVYSFTGCSTVSDMFKLIDPNNSILDDHVSIHCLFVCKITIQACGILF